MSAHYLADLFKLHAFLMKNYRLLTTLMQLFGANLRLLKKPSLAFSTTVYKKRGFCKPHELLEIGNYSQFGGPSMARAESVLQHSQLPWSSLYPSEKYNIFLPKALLIIAGLVVPALGIVKRLNVVKNIRDGLLSGLEVAMMDQFGFEGVEEAFQGSVVPAVSLSGHGADNSVFFQYVLVFLTVVLATSPKIPLTGILLIKRQLQLNC